MMRDYARVDVRLDALGRIYVLEINANPCLSPDAGFVAAAEYTVMKYAQMVEKFVDFMNQRSQSHGNQVHRPTG